MSAAKNQDFNPNVKLTLMFKGDGVLANDNPVMPAMHTIFKGCAIKISQTDSTLTVLAEVPADLESTIGISASRLTCRFPQILKDSMVELGVR